MSNPIAPVSRLIIKMSPIRHLALTLALLAWAVTASGQITVTGRVTMREDNGPLPGVNVVEKGTPNGTVTQADGSFTLTVKDKNATLIVSFIGYVTQEIDLSGRNNIEITLKTDCIRDWFDAQKIRLYLSSGIINTPAGGQFDLSFPAYFGKGTLDAGISYQTNLDRNRFLNGRVELKHFVFNCDFDMNAGWFYRSVDFQNNFRSRAFSLETNFNFRRLGLIAGYSNLDFTRIEKNHNQTYAGPLVGLSTWVPGKLRLSIRGKMAIYKNKQEFIGEISRDSRYIDAFVRYYKWDTFDELSIGIGTSLTYRFRHQKR